MPFLEGRTLREALRQSRFSPDRAAVLVRQLGSAIAANHETGMVHRDLKPENLMLTRDSQPIQVVIIDFGTAGLRGAESQLAATTLLAGSFHYMAPERLTGHYAPASDTFAFAVIILEMATGKRLSDLHAYYSDGAFRRELEDALRQSAGSAVAGGLADSLLPAFHPDPRLRPQDILAWTEQIAALLELARPASG